MSILKRLQAHRGVVGVLGATKNTLNAVRHVVSSFKRGFFLIDNPELAEYWATIHVESCITPRSHDPFKIVSNLFEIQKYRKLEQISDEKRLGNGSADEFTVLHTPAYIVMDMTSMTDPGKVHDHFELMSKSKDHDCLCILLLSASQLPATIVDYWLFADLGEYANSVEKQHQLVRWAFHEQRTQQELNELTEAMNTELNKALTLGLTDSLLLVSIRNEYKIVDTDSDTHESLPMPVSTTDNKELKHKENKDKRLAENNDSIYTKTEDCATAEDSCASSEGADLDVSWLDELMDAPEPEERHFLGEITKVAKPVITDHRSIKESIKKGSDTTKTSWLSRLFGCCARKH